MSDTSSLQSGVRLTAPSTEQLISTLKARQDEVGIIVAERIPKHASGRLSNLVDGVWSPTTIKAVHRLSAVAVQMNALWASLPPDWKCPCCKQTKDKMIHAVVDKNAPEKGRTAIAHAVEHHDHFVAYVNHAFHRELGKDWSRRFEAAHEVQRRLAAGVTAFDPTVICEPCNLAEGKAKMVLWRRLKLEKEFRDYFSFALDEIRAFIRPVANAAHDIDEAVVVEIFERRRKQEIMRFRKDAVDTQARLLKEGSHWRTAEPAAPDGNAVNDSYQTTLLEFGLEQGSNFCFTNFSATSQGQPSDPDGWIDRLPKRTGSVMNREAEEFLCSDPMAKYLGRGWACPCCDRPTRAAIRRNNKRALTLQPRVVRPGGAEPQTVCIDCCTSMQLIARSAEAARDDVIFNEVREVFAFASNEAHWVRSADVARAVIERVRTRAAATRTAAETEFQRFATERIAVKRSPLGRARQSAPSGYY